MKNDLWEAVHDIFRKLDELFGHQRAANLPRSPDPSREDAELELADQPSTNRTLPLDELLLARSELRKELDVVRTRLADRLNERDAYLVLFAVVAHFDELVQMRFLKGDKLSWPTLQRELFQVDDAGEVFYETLDDILLKPQTLPFILEVYYLCLNDGFQGRYDRNPARIREYMERLRQRIPFEAPEPVQHKEAEQVEIVTKRSPAVYYFSAAAILLAFYGLLMTAAWFWNPLMER
ncbi:MAG: DotU family type IV/VI secretion system protein [Syntrophobacteraceae bacterium]